MNIFHLSNHHLTKAAMTQLKSNVSFLRVLEMGAVLLKTVQFSKLLKLIPMAILISIQHAGRKTGNTYRPPLSRAVTSPPPFNRTHIPFGKQNHSHQFP
jgi:hypothetical protein